MVCYPPPKSPSCEGDLFYSATKKLIPYKRYLFHKKENALTSIPPFQKLS